MATDAAGIALAFGAVTLTQRPPGGRRTFGWQRLEILAAVANGLLLIAVAGFVFRPGVRRIGHPPEVDAGPMLVIAAVGLAVNPVSLAVLHQGRTTSLNVRGAYLEVLADALGLGGGRRRPRHRRYGLDPRRHGRGRLPGDRVPRRAPDVGSPAGGAGLGVDGVIGVHDLHAWTITSGRPVLSTHVVVTDEALDAGHGGRVLEALCECLGEHFDMAHCTFQLEGRAHAGHGAPVHD